LDPARDVEGGLKCRKNQVRSDNWQQRYQNRPHYDADRRGILKWSGKFGQCAKMYPNRMNGYDNDETTELFRQIQGYCGA
jgi:hypothetical protein